MSADAGGLAGIAFDSSATDLVAGDTNAVRDVFFTTYDGVVLRPLERASVGPNGAQGTGGDSSHASIAVRDAAAGDVSVAFESAKNNLVAGRNVFSTVDAYLHRTAGPRRTLLLNQRRLPGNAAIGGASDLTGMPAPADSRAPVLSGDGQTVLFETIADNLDADLQGREPDLNRVSDVVLVDLSRIDEDDTLAPIRLSVARAGAHGDGPSTRAAFAELLGPTGSRFTVGVGVYASRARNTGATEITAGGDSGPVVAFIDPTFGTREIPNAAFSAERSGDPLGPRSLGVLDTDGVFKGGAPLRVQFRSDSVSARALRWEFGDGTVSTEENPVHEYAQVGSYDVKLSIESAAGAVLRETKPGFVRVFAPPQATITSPSPPADVQPFAVDFVGPAPAPLDRYDWEWTFGDGGTSGEQSPRHTYADPGVYRASLRVVGFGGADATPPARQRQVRVFERVHADFTPSSPVTIMAGGQVVFTDLSTGDLLPAGAWLWDFGDGTTSAEQHPLHTFMSPGRRTVSLTVFGQSRDPRSVPENPNRAVASRSELVLVQGELEARFSPMALTRIRGAGESLFVDFMDQSGGTVSPVAWAWDFGNGTTSMQRNPTMVEFLEAAGSTSTTYPVRLTVTGPLGEMNTNDPPGTITIHELIRASFTQSAASGATPLDVVFTDATTGAANSWSWNFGTGLPRSTIGPHTIRYEGLAALGTRTVRLVVGGDGDDGNPANNTATSTVTVFPDFDLIYDQVLVPNCSTSVMSCHNGSAPDMSTVGAAFSALRNGTALRGGTPCPYPPSHPTRAGQTYSYVVVGSASDSYLFVKVAGTPPANSMRCGSRMPNSAGLADAEIRAIEAWINNGAVR